MMYLLKCWKGFDMKRLLDFCFFIPIFLVFFINCSKTESNERYDLALDAYRKHQLDVTLLFLEGEDLDERESEIYLKALYYKNDIQKFWAEAEKRNLSDEIFLLKMRTVLYLNQKVSGSEWERLQKLAGISPEANLLILKLGKFEKKSIKIQNIGTKMKEFEHYLQLTNKLLLSR